MATAAYIDIHALQTLPYSNLNRDDLGSPKTLILGGAERTRISSQSWKRVVRHRIEERMHDPAVRTRRIVAGIAERLEEVHGWSAKAAQQGGLEVVRCAGKGIKLEKPKAAKDGADKTEVPPETSVLFYLPSSAVDALADLAARHAEAVAGQIGKKNLKPVLPADEVTAILSGRNASVRLFGRMLAELPTTEVDGAVQFAHAFTVHGTNIDIDFFTAVDDLLAKKTDRGSGHMNEAMFSAGTFYRYANINLTQLLANSDGDAEETRRLAGEFLRAFLDTVPSAKQTSTAAVTVPELVHVVVRSDRPASYAGAFEEPVSGEHGHMDAARARLDAYARDLKQVWWPDEVLYSGHSGIGLEKELSGLGEGAGSYPALVASALKTAQEEGIRGEDH